MANIFELADNTPELGTAIIKVIGVGGGGGNAVEHMVNSDVQFINFESMLVSNLPDKKFAVHPNSIEFHRVSGIFRFPDKMKSILSKGMFSTCQIHFFAPSKLTESRAHANFVNLVSGAQQSLSNINRNQELNLVEGRIPPMFENMGILRQM